MTDRTARVEAIIAREHLALAIWWMRRSDRDGAHRVLQGYRQMRKALWGEGRKSASQIYADGHCRPTRKAAT